VTVFRTDSAESDRLRLRASIWHGFGYMAGTPPVVASENAALRNLCGQIKKQSKERRSYQCRGFKRNETRFGTVF